ncbi:Uncharacterised protein [Segatella copri]|nr:Uncharacterised protein [Segatella copri]
MAYSLNAVVKTIFTFLGTTFANSKPLICCMWMARKSMSRWL